MPVRLAWSMSLPETSRTWPTLPGADGSSEVNTVWTESMTRTCGSSPSAAWMISSSCVSAST